MQQQALQSDFQSIPNARTVLVRQGGGWGPMSNWAIRGMYVTPEKAMELQSAAVLEGLQVKVCKYDDLDKVLGGLD